MIHKRYLLPLLCGILLQSGCTTIDPNLTMQVESAEHFSAPNAAKGAKLTSEWYSDFGSQNLVSLIERGLAQSPDILVAFERINQAKILKQNAAAPLLPSLDFRGNTSASARESQNANTSRSDVSNAELSMSYELDVFGRIAANVRLAEANIATSKYDYEALKLTLAASIAQNYFLYQSTRQKATIAKNNLEIAQKVLDIMEARLRFGSINALDVSRQKNTLFTQEANLINLQNQLKAYKNAIAVLVGVSPNSFEIAKESLEEFSVHSIEAGLPSELLLRRPDIASSRAAIDASKAAIQVSDAARYPSFSLSGSSGVSSADLLAFRDPAYALSAGLGVSYNIFDDGRLTNARRIEESKANAVLQNYRSRVLTAFKEVEDALNTLHFTTQNLELAQKTLKESAYTFELATIQYKNGLIDFNTFLDVQQSFFSAKERLLSAKQERLIAQVTLYKALGGGFELKPNESAVTQASKSSSSASL